MTLQELARSLQEVDDRKAELLQQRDRRIRKELKAGGITKSQVAVLTGLSRQRVGQIAEEK